MPDLLLFFVIVSRRLFRFKLVQFVEAVFSPPDEHLQSLVVDSVRVVGPTRLLQGFRHSLLD